MLRTALCALVLAACSSRSPAKPAPAPVGWCTPEQPCWPTPADWDGLRAQLTGALEVPSLAVTDPKNPFSVEDSPGGTLSTGWLDAWTAAPSAYAVVARNAGDVAAAVTFAHDHRLRLVIKGTGHDYLGRSSAPDSLLVWTHEMRTVTVQDAFVPEGCTDAGIPAVTLGAGTRWLEAYQAVTVEHHRYVQGGGCTSVGAAGGFLQGGGFGSWSKKYGTAAAGMLEAEVVIADGSTLIANACQHQDLFWALRGGGGGTFGAVTRVTLRTHPLPDYFGLVFGTIAATSDAAFQELIEHFLRFYGERLSDEHWGEQVTIEDDNSLALSMAFEGLSAKDVEKLWAPFRAWIDEQPDRFTMQLGVIDMPGEKMWDTAYLQEHFGDGIHVDPAHPGLFWWTSNDSEFSTFWYAYQSRWIPADRFAGDAAARFAKTLFDASRHWPVALHFNKGQAGAAAEALARDRETSMNPAVYDAAALAIMAADGDPADTERATAERAEVDAAAAIVREATPGAGSYVNETSYFEEDWQRELWGASYDRLLRIKQQYDPDGLFYCHHCVGSEARASGTTSSSPRQSHSRAAMPPSGS